MNKNKAAKPSRKTSSAAAAAAEPKKKSNPRDRRDPLKDLLNNTSSVSVEAPRGCFRFLLSNPSSRTPKSAPNARTLNYRKDPTTSSNLRSRPPLKKPTNPKQPQKPNNPDLFHSQSPSLEGQFLIKETHSSKPHKHSGLSTFRSSYLDLTEQSTATPLKTGNLSVRAVLESNDTPASRLASWSCLGSTPDKILKENSSSATTTTVTPPVQASISPEIQCGSSTIYTPACYGAGHVVVGVTDKRKCRPRGILTVGEEVLNKNLGIGVSNGGSGGARNDTRISLVPAPAEACVNWLASPCDDTSRETGSAEFVSTNQVTKAWLLSPYDVANKGNGSPESIDTFVISSSTAAAAASHCSCRVLTPQQELRYRGYDDLIAKNSPFSWGSPNLICTPLSDSSSNMQFGLEDLLDCQLEVSSVSELLPPVSLSPQSWTVTRGSIDILPLPGLSFQFSSPMTTPYNSNDGAHFQMPPYDQTFRQEESCQQVRRTSTYTSQVRISWREGLVSRIFDLDESDCCRWLSDEEEEEDTYRKNDQFESDFGVEFELNIPSSTLTDENGKQLTNGFASPEFLYEERGEGKSEVKLPPHGPVSCAESISTEGGGLVASGDSDWTLCYKNHLFENPFDKSC